MFIIFEYKLKHHCCFFFCLRCRESSIVVSTEMCLTSLRNVQCLDKQKTSNGNNWADESIPKSHAELQKESSPVISTVKVQEHAAMPTEYVDKDIGNKVKNNDFNRCLRQRGHVQGEVVSTVCTAVQNAENMAGCKLYSDSVRRLDRSGNTGPVVRLDSYRLRTSSAQRQKQLTRYDIALAQKGLSDKSHFQAGETGSYVSNSVKHPLTACLSRHQFPDVGEHLSTLANSTNKTVEESHVDQLSKASCIPETVQPVDGKENPKNHGQLKNACFGVQGLENGCEIHSGSCIKSIIKPPSEYRLPTDIQFISGVDNCDKEEIHNKVYENSCHTKDQRKALKEKALCNAADTCIRQCYVKLVRLEDTSQEIRISPRRTRSQIKKNSFLADSDGLKNNLLKCTSSKTCGNINGILHSHHRHAIDNERLKTLHTTSNGSMKSEPRKANTRQKNSHLFRSGCRKQISGMVSRFHSGLRTQDSGMVSHLNVKEISPPVPTLDNVVVFQDSAMKTGGDIKHSEENILYVNTTSKLCHSNVTYGNIEGFVDCEKSDICSVSSCVSTQSKNEKQLDHITSQSWSTAGTNTYQKTESSLEDSGSTVWHVQGDSSTDCVQIELHKHFGRKTSDGKKRRSRKLLNGLQPYKLSLLAKMKPVSVNLERLDQSIVEKYSTSISGVTSMAIQQKSTEFLSQEMISTGNGVVNIGSGGHWNGRGELERLYYDKIPCLDGTFEISSSDDCSDSRSPDHFRQLEKSPVTKEAGCPEEIIEKDENNLPDQNHEIASCSGSSSLIGTPPKEPHVGPAKNLKNTSSSYKTYSTVQSPRKSLYPPLTIKIRKSPKKGNVNTEDKLHERYPHKSDRSKPVKCITVYSNCNRCSKKEQSGRLSGEEGIERRSKHMALKQKFTNDQAHEHPKGMCDLLQKRKRKSSILLSHCRHRDTTAELTVTPSIVCHDAGARDDQQDTCTEKHGYVLSSFTATC